MSSDEQPPSPDNERWYRINQVSRMAGVKSSVLRYWESEFPMLQPIKSTTGYRIYSQEEVDLVLKIKHMLYEEGLTVAGARRQLEEAAKGGSLRSGNGAAPTGNTTQPGATPVRSAAPSANGSTVNVDRQTLLELREALRAFLTLLERK